MTDPIRRVRRWHCERCEGTACEITSDEGEAPVVCPCGHMADWRLDRWTGLRWSRVHCATRFQGCRTASRPEHG